MARGAGGPSIVDNPAFAALRKQLGAEKASGLQFLDLPQTAGDGYQLALLLSRLYLGLADMAGARTPPLVLPPLKDLREHLAPSLSVSYADDAGWHLRSRVPFPGSQILGAQAGNFIIGSQAATVPIAIGILLPALGASRQTAMQMKSVSQARGIHQGAVIYANSQKGKLPQSLRPLYEGDYFTVELVVSPFAATRIPPDFRTWPKDRQADWVDANASYAIVPGRTDDADATKVTVYEKLSPNSRGIAVVYGDGHGEWLPLDRARPLIQAQLGRSPEELSGQGGRLRAQTPPPAPR
jgi:hypothetical protein